MTPTNGSGRAFRAQIGMSLVIDVGSYSHAGNLMDAIGAAVSKILHDGGEAAEFDFVSFNTQPCKTARMSQIAVMDPGDIAYSGDSPYAPQIAPALTQH